MFECSRCGACCSNLKEFHGIYDDLDNGNGCCKYFDSTTKLCTIYDTRPQKCNIDESFRRFSSFVSYSIYIESTKIGCQYLKSKINNIKI
jgi:Fe-S-cluster containining protein